ncbi:NACHT, LRR and PYD domains-containing protein 12-like [Hemitrygon akajei]|uniref:NACHT, LRR and PYD domains-containing protein 12-like n=1 Tax=Hemitrygon akajei TaxID=2704970 RepID=UPI003BF9E8C5
MDTERKASRRFLTKFDNYQILQLTKCYRTRLEEAIVNAVEGVSFVLAYKRYFSCREHQDIINCIEKGTRADSAKLLLSVVLEKDCGILRLIWNSFMKMHHILPKLDVLLKEMEKPGMVESHVGSKIKEGLSELPAHLKEPNCGIAELLAKWDDFRLFQLTNFYRDRLEQAMEGGVHGVSSALTYTRHFNGREHRKVTELADKRERAESSNLLLNLVIEKGSEAQRVMWETFVKMRNSIPKLDKVLKEIQEYGFDPYDHLKINQGLPIVPRSLKGKHWEKNALTVFLHDVQQKHKETLRVQTEKLRVNTILMREKVKVFQLVDRYAELTVISTVRDRRLVEHELLARGRDHEEWREEHLRKVLEKIRADQLFQSSFSRSNSKSGSSAAVAGVPGIGKTTMVQKIVYDWATGKIYQQFQFVFSFKFRDLNSINCRINLKELILDQYPYFGNLLGEVWKNPEVLLFIFDGLDEFKHRIDFAGIQRDTDPQSTCTDPEFKCKVSDIVCSLIQHKLLPGCSVLVTTRPTALDVLEKAEISVWAEILGFVGEERKEYFIRHFEDQTVAAAVFKHVKENEILYTMSYNPSYCWILALALGPFFTQRVRDPQRVPKTITQLYSYYIYNILKNHGREIESPRDALLKLGEMAFTGVSEKKIVFRDGDLIKYNLQPSQFLSGFLMQLLERDDSSRGVVYTFPHLTIQEFVAALAQFLTPDPGDILKLLTKAHSMTDGRFEVFLRFIAGLSSSGSARAMEGFLGPFLRQTTCQVIDWVKDTVEYQLGNSGSEDGKRRLLNILHYLFESQNSGLARATLGSVKTLSLSGLRLTPIDCAVLSHIIVLCDTIKHLDLRSCYLQLEEIQRLGPGLHKCEVLGLWNNELGDSGVKLVAAALRNPECKIQKLRLNYNGLTASCAKDFASALTVNHSLVVLDLGGNELGDAGVKPLFECLSKPECKIEELCLWALNLTDSCTKDLSSALATNNSLTGLDLGSNKLSDSGVKQLSVILGKPDCKLQTLGLFKNGLSDSSAEDLASVLKTNNSLKELDLGHNELGDSGVKLVSVALRNAECKIQKLWLWDVSLTYSGAEDLASALSTNTSLTELDMSENELGDSGVKLVSAALRNLECKIQTLEMIDVGLTDSGAEDLVSALSTNTSLMELNLSNNELGDSGVKLVSAALRNPECKIQKLGLIDVGLTDSGAEDLASALSTNPLLTGLDLSENKLGDAGVKIVSVALRNPECKIQKLRLTHVSLTDSGTENLASALSANPSLTELNLSDNHLGDSGVKLVSAALRNPECKIQKLWLDNVGLTDSGAEDLVSALSTNPSLTVLNLGYNSLTDRSVPAICRLILTLPSLEWICLGSNQFSEIGGKELRCLQGVRPGLRVICEHLNV